jgi:hypothetical protein
MHINILYYCTNLKRSISVTFCLYLGIHNINVGVESMFSVCEKENEDGLRLLASNRNVMELILRLGVVVNASSLVGLMNQGFRMKDIQCLCLRFEL